MNRKAHHIRLYKRLNLHDSATITDLKKSYFHLANKYHPDKVAQTESSSTNAQLFNEVQNAYRELKQFHEQHGHLPLNTDFESSEHTNKTYPHSSAHRFGTIRRSSYLLSGVLFTLLLILLFLPYPDDRNTTSPKGISSSKNRLKSGDDLSTHTDPHIRHRPSLAELQTQPIKTGLSMVEVFDLLGVPDSTINNQWYYGSSEIYFRDGLVSGWNISPKSPIWTDKSLPSYVTPQPRLR
jgi:hypothetical protein